MSGYLIFTFGLIAIPAMVVMGCAEAEQAKEDVQIPRSEQLVAEPDPPDNLEVDEQPEAIKKLNPEYPEEARRQKLEGTVYVKALVNRDGTVRKAKISESDNPIFDEASINAIQGWEFSPAIKDGEPVAVWVVVPVKFKLE